VAGGLLAVELFLLVGFGWVLGLLRKRRLFPLESVRGGGPLNVF